MFRDGEGAEGDACWEDWGWRGVGQLQGGKVVVK